jgi:arylsulfatase
MGKLENTLIIYISGDNGASAEGTLVGTPNEIASLNGANVPVAAQLKDFYDIWGSAQTFPHFAVPWHGRSAHPINGPSRSPHISEARGRGWQFPGPVTSRTLAAIRPQFHHVIDIVPTLLEASGIRAPEVVDGIKQKPIEGVSMAYTFDAAGASKPSTHKTQYFEMAGVHAIYHDGWVAATSPVRAPWEFTGAAMPDPATGFKWELYNISKDWTENNNLAAINPQRLKELQALFWVEARKYQVLPLDASALTRFVAPRPNITAGRTEFNYTLPVTGIPLGDAPNLLNTSYTITADIDVPAGGAEGLLMTQGGRFGGWGLYLVKGRPVFTWNLLDLNRVRWEGPEQTCPRQAHVGI